MSDMYDFRLKVFQRVAWNLSFTKAAQELQISQPAVTKHIRELESIYNTRLFDRVGNKIALTAAGIILLKHCDTILSEYSKLNYKMHQLNNKEVGQIHIGASLTIAQYILPVFLAQFCQEYPDISLDLQMHNTLEIENMLHAQKIDIGLIEGPSRKPYLKYSPFLKDEIVAIVRNTARWGDSPFPLSKIKELPLILREHTSGTTQFIEENLQKYGIKYSSLNVLMHMGSTEGIKSFLRHSDCVGLLYIYSVSKELMNGEFRIIDFQDFTIEREFCFVQNQGDNSEINQLFINFINKKSSEQYGHSYIGK